MSKEVDKILKKYSILVQNDGSVTFGRNSEETLRNMMMIYLGISYQIGTYLYDTKKEDRTKETEQGLKEASGEMSVLKKIMLQCNYEPLINLYK